MWFGGLAAGGGEMATKQASKAIIGARMEHFGILPPFNKWAFQTLKKSVDKLSDAQYFGRVSCLYFGSVHATVNHIVAADRLWLGRVTNGLDRIKRAAAGDATASSLATLQRIGVEHLWNAAPPAGSTAHAVDSVWSKFIVDRAGAWNALDAGADRWIGLLGDAKESVPPSPLMNDQTLYTAKIDYLSTSGEAVVGKPLAPLLMHAINHSTHHRGQISAALTHYGLDAPEVDLLYWVLQQNQ